MERWELLQSLVVRSTGFPIELLGRLRFVRTTTCVREILACETAIGELQRELLTERLPRIVEQAYARGDRGLLAALSKWRRAVSRRRATDGLAQLPALDCDLQALLNRWNQMLDQHTTLIKAGETAWQAELDEQRRRLRQTAGDPRVQEAILLSSPDMYMAVQRYLGDDTEQERNGPLRRFERRLIFYLQRLCVKNETQSFFGPINYGRLDQDQPLNLQISRAPHAIRRREVFPSQWMVETLAARVGSEPELRPFLRPRRSPLCLYSEGRLCFPASNQTIACDSLMARLFELADGCHTVAEMACLTGEDETTTWGKLEQLQRRNALITQIIIPGDISDPLAYLRRWVADLPEVLPARTRWIANLDDLHSILDHFACADLAERERLLAQLEAHFSDLCEDPARRRMGMMYADRLLLFEECLGDLEQCTLGGDLAQTIVQQLQPILRLAEVYGRLLALRDQEIARAVWQQVPGTNQAMPFLAYLRAVKQSTPPASEPDQLDRFLADLHAVVRAHSNQRHVYLRGDELPIPNLAPEPDACRYCSLDLLIAAPSLPALQEGAFEIVLGEVHPQPLLWLFPTAYFLEDGGEALGHVLREDLQQQPGGAAAAQLIFTRKNKIYPYTLPGATIEMRPHYPDCRAIPLAALQVYEQAGRLLLGAGDSRFRLYTPLNRSRATIDPLAPFAFPAVLPPPIDFGEHTPRIQIENIIYQRERWSVAGELFHMPQAHGFDLFLEIWRRKERLGLPEEIFVRAPQEPKPIYIDLSNYFLIELFTYVARQSQRLTLTEMLPNRDQLWLEDTNGRYCCEFRTLAIGQQQE